MRKIKLLLSILSLFSSVSASALSGTLYYDICWREVTKDDAYFYRKYTLMDTIFKIEDYYMDGLIYKTGYVSSIASNRQSYREGAFVFYDHSGHKTREGYYIHGAEKKVWRSYFPNSEALREERSIGDGKEQGENYTLKYDSASRQLISKTKRLTDSTSIEWIYKAGDTILKEVSTRLVDGLHIKTIKYKDHSVYIKENKEVTNGELCYDEYNNLLPCDPADKAFSYIEQMPRAIADIRTYLNNNLVYPKRARKQGIEGKIIIKFVVEEDGAVAYPWVAQGINAECDAEALRVVADMPYWKPGLQQGRPVKVMYTLPITFKLE